MTQNVIIKYLSDSCLGFAQEAKTVNKITNLFDSVYEHRNRATLSEIWMKLLGLNLQNDVILMNHFSQFEKNQQLN